MDAPIFSTDDRLDMVEAADAIVLCSIGLDAMIDRVLSDRPAPRQRAPRCAHGMRVDQCPLDDCR